MEIRELINHNNFDTLVSDEELLDALRIIFKDVIKGFIPINWTYLIGSNPPG